MAAAAAKKCARWPRPCARSASTPWSAQRHRRAPGLGGRPGRRRPVRRRRHAGLRAQRRLAHRGRPHPRQAQAERLSRLSHGHSRRPPAGSTGTPARASRASSCRAGAVDAHCHVFGPGAEFPYAPERKYTPCDASQGAAVRAARPPRLRAQRDRAGHLPRRRQPRAWSTRCSAVRRQGARRGHRQAQRHRRELQAMHEAGVRGVRFNFVKRLVDFTPQGRADGDRRAHRAARLARGDLLRGGGPARAVGLLHRAADHRGRRPHGPARREQAGRRPGVRAVREVHARAPERLEQGQLPGAPVASPARRR